MEFAKRMDDCGAPCSSLSLEHGRAQDKKKYTLSPKLITLLDFCHAAMLHRIDAVLQLLNVRYFIYASTLVGAIRDARRIPWDDDIDIRIHPDDWDRLSSNPAFRTNWTDAEQRQLWVPVDDSNRDMFRRWFAQDGVGLTGMRGGLIWNWNFTQRGRRVDTGGNWLQAAEPRCMDPNWLVTGGPSRLRHVWENSSEEVLAARRRPSRRSVFVADLVNAAATIGRRSWRRSWNLDAPQPLWMDEAYVFDLPLARTSVNGVAVSGPSYQMAERLMVPWYGKAWADVLDPPSFSKCRKACLHEYARRPVPTVGDSNEDLAWRLFARGRKRIFSYRQRLAASRRGRPGVFWGLNMLSAAKAEPPAHQGGSRPRVPNARAQRGERYATK